MSDRIQVTVKNHVADVKLVRADKMNALDDAMFTALIKTTAELEANRDVRVVVLSGELKEGEKVVVSESGGKEKRGRFRLSF